MPLRSAKARQFRQLHESCFVIGNAWDAGSARILAGLGYQALATSSGAHAGTLGRRDGARDARRGAGARQGHRRGDRPAGVGGPRELLRRRARGRGRNHPPRRGRRPRRLLDRGCDQGQGLRLRAGGGARRRRRQGGALACMCRSLTARAENFVRGKPDLDDTIKRLQAYEKAGADVLMAPGCRTSRRCARCARRSPGRSTSWPASRASRSACAELQAAGVKRVSLATSLWRMRDERR